MQAHTLVISAPQTLAAGAPPWPSLPAPPPSVPPSPSPPPPDAVPSSPRPSKPRPIPAQTLPTPHLIPPPRRFRRRPPRRYHPGHRVQPLPPASPALTVTVSPEDAIPDDSYPFEKLIIETAALARFGGTKAARARLSAAGCGEHYAGLLTAQALFVDGKVDEAIAAFEELAREDPGDYRPLFCQGVLYFFLGREAESNSMLERCREVAGDTFGPDFTVPVSEAEAAEAEAELVAEKL